MLKNGKETYPRPKTFQVAKFQVDFSFLQQRFSVNSFF